MKDRWVVQEKERRICAVNESTLSTADTVPLPHAGKAYKVSQSPVIPLISGEWIVSHMWHEILRLSPHLFWLGLFKHRVFSSAQDDDTRGRMGSHRIGRMDGEFIFPIAAFL